MEDGHVPSFWLLLQSAILESEPNSDGPQDQVLLRAQKGSRATKEPTQRFQIPKAPKAIMIMVFKP